MQQSRSRTPACSKNCTLKALFITVATLILAPKTSDAAAATAGSNSAVFQHLCTLVNAVTEVEKVGDVPATVTQIHAIAERTALIFRAAKELEELAAQTPGTTKKEVASKKPNTICTEQLKDACDNVAAYLKQMKPQDRQHLLAFVASGNPAVQLVNDTANSLLLKTSNFIADAEKRSNKEVPKHLRTAFYSEGKDSVTNAIFTATSGRNSECGSQCGAAATGAKNNLAATLLCLCAGDSTNFKPSCQTCDNEAVPAVTFTTAGNYATSAFEKIKTICKRRAETPTLSRLPQAIAAAIRAVTADLAAPKGNNPDVGTIGGITTGGRPDCDGSNTAGKGACVYLGANGNAPKKPTWLDELTQALLAAKTAAKAELDSTAQAAHIEGINTTLALALLNGIYQTQANSSQQTHQEAPQHPREHMANSAKTQKECEQHKDNKTACAEAKCKWKGGDDEKGDCEVDETKVTEQTITTETGEGATGTTNTEDKRCSEKKKQEDWKESCILESNDCKNSSFLVNNKFVLSMDATFLDLFL
ncbi:variant surface glycoprotein VSG [Trypanosoma brucei equiperdum]|uniref:Variant surface glycoprotein VSG n=1 Tax=Trypanosoma brucei equiperdum TaxID=630700 RepID=A0A3L6KSJ3_9TRYP|nr:variant surface glycoprotein VSG [Trypanosoma brucei equiperdum]RHW66802.1 variant surface glycoprotein VSG [Trypanosoma brucei equiperdum]RHW66812.1 variant surface glycoprotein VSG [Trypanosoma brucei equiperdum]RHW66856.1 variant surface glycoprotein VSG [Trypanosoma brucei equiperdum]RHW66878.1 variant surface glycoprotein VSG [Trypanosoma brucei equiperdum]